MLAELAVKVQDPKCAALFSSQQRGKNVVEHTGAECPVGCLIGRRAVLSTCGAQFQGRGPVRRNRVNSTIIQTMRHAVKGNRT